jgi:alpha-tubulin suppressor-like RCC1 family protein
MSELRVDSVKSKGGGAPDLPKGVTISGITTAVTLGATQIDVSNVNVSGVVTSATLNGPLLSTGTPTLGLGVTINSSGLHITGVATAGIVSATTLYGDGTNITGVGATIAPLFYNPDASDSAVTYATGIGITFNQQIKAGTGNITIRENSASGTVVENFGVGSSVTISENRVTFSPTTNLSESKIYHLSYPSGCFTNMAGESYVGTAYTFQTIVVVRQLWVWGLNDDGQLGQNQGSGGNPGSYSSPVQVPGNWSSGVILRHSSSAISLGKLYTWGDNSEGQLGQNQGSLKISSPVQVGSDSNWNKLYASGSYTNYATKTDGTLWGWGANNSGQLGQNEGPSAARSSPIQIPGTTWSTVANGQLGAFTGGIKTDGTLWLWGKNEEGQIGNNLRQNDGVSSPIQVPGTTWSHVSGGQHRTLATKTDGTAWAWGNGGWGQLGQNDRTSRSSPVQIPGTNWASIDAGERLGGGVKTDGTLWMWGYGGYGSLAQNNETSYSSPVQVPGTNWSTSVDQLMVGQYVTMAMKTDGTLWSWGYNNKGQAGNNAQGTNYSSPIQIPGTEWTSISHSVHMSGMAIKTPT